MLACLEGELLIPQTVCHLTCAKSYSPCGKKITKFHWSGAGVVFVPNADVPAPTATLNAAGEIQICLEVWDEDGVKSCAPKCQSLLVIPTNALHVDLLWHTPADKDETDSGPGAGAALDLHFANQLASTLDIDCDGVPDPWFDNPNDVNWFNSTPEWGKPGFADDNATLDLDDTDGAGPENLNLKAPEGSVAQPVAYSLGVNYWTDHGYGPSFATVAIWVSGAKAAAFADQKLDPCDMWYVGKINWPNKLSGGTLPVIDVCHQTGLACLMGKNAMWQPAGDPCITPKYVNAMANPAIGGGACQ